jgi:acetyl-CoA acetyltransferase
MALTNSFIPYGAYWSSPFCRWQGSLSGESSVTLAARTAAGALERRGIETSTLDGLVLGLTVPQKHSFYGAPWVAGMMGAEHMTGPTISQACATSARILATCAAEVESGQQTATLALACDRTSNGPHLYYPNPKGVGGKGDAEEWVWDNFNHDPHAGNAMIQTAENVAAKAGITRQEQDEMAALRFGQYQEALADNGAFHKRYMEPVQMGRGKRATTVEADEGVHPTTQEGLAGLKPVLEGGTVTFGTQTHPADGHAGLIVCTQDKARDLSSDKNITIRVLGFGQARVEKGFMPMAVVPAAQAALNQAGVSLPQ